jgi:hypothetical protein
MIVGCGTSEMDSDFYLQIVTPSHYKLIRRISDPEKSKPSLPFFLLFDMG